MKIKLIILGVPALILVILIASFFATKERNAEELNQLIISSIGDASYLNPVLAQDSASSDINAFLFNGLLKYDKNLNITGDLASSWTIKKGEKPSIVFHLRKGVKWHDGVEFTSRDVKFTFETIMDEKTNTVRKSDYELVEKIVLPDRYTVEVKYAEPFSPGLESWTIGIIPEHILAGKNINTTSFNRNPIGTGAFRFKKWVSDEKIVVTANDDYFEGKPYLDKIIYRIIPETSLSEIELLTGGIDFSGIYPHQYKRIKKQKDLQVYSYLGHGYSYIGYNLTKPLFKDINVRKALTCSLNRKAILRYCLNGKGKITSGPFPNQMWYYNHDVAPYPYDPAEAKKLLAEAGWSDHNGDGILDRNGKTLSFTLITNSGNDIRRDIAVLAQRQWQKLGIDVQLRFYEWSTFINTYINPKHFDACLLGWSLSIDPDQYAMWHSSQIEDGFNFISYRNKEVDRLLVEGRRTYDKEKRRAIYYRIHEIISDEQPYTFLFVRESLMALRKKFVVVEKNVDGEAEFAPIKIARSGLMYDLIKWYVPDSRERAVYKE